MAKRIILSSLPVCIIIAIIALVLASLGRGQPSDTPADIEQLKSQVISLIQSGKYDDANSAVVQIIVLSASRDKGHALQQIASAYQNAAQADRAIPLCNYVLQNWPKEDFAVIASMSMAISQIDKGNFDETDAIAGRMTVDYADDPNLPVTLSVIADTYSWRKKFDRAGILYGVIENKFPNSPFASKAKIAIVGVNALSLIEDKKFPTAKEQMLLMISDFNNQPDLYPMLLRIGQEFSWRHSFAEAEIALDEISAKTQDASLSQQAKLWSARSKICSIIAKSNDSEIISSIDKLMSDFNDNAGLPEAVYWVSKEYEWKKGTSIGRDDWYDSPNSVYQKIMLQFNNTPYGAVAEWDQKRLAYRMKIFKLMQEPNQSATDAAIENMITDFKGRPELSGELYWIACGYEEHKEKCPLAKQLYERIVKDCPGTEEAGNSALDLQRRIMCDYFDAGDTNSGTAALDKFVADFGQNLYAGNCLGRAVRGFYLAGKDFKDTNQPDKARQYFQTAATIWERIATNNIQPGTDAAYSYLYAAMNYEQLNKWSQALEIYQKILNDYPGFELACGVQAAIGGCYEMMRDMEGVPKEGVNPLIKEAFKAVLANWPDCYSAVYVSMRLGDMALEEGDIKTAQYYYQQFLTKAKPKDKRIEMVKAKLAELAAQGGNN
jgi:tetratricopeptide (TPR) repeat protein